MKTGKRQPKKVCVLGGGRVGRAIALDLAQRYRVMVVDQDPAPFAELEGTCQTQAADLSRVEEIQGLVEDQDLVVGALPGFMGFQTAGAVIAAGKNLVDISFFAEDPFQLHERAIRQEVTAVIDCGVAPGLSNLILGYHCRESEVTRYECLVGGLPFERSWPFQYKAPFSPIDVVEEYTRPARLVERGKVVTRPALSQAEYVEIRPVGTLEAFNTDGLRTLLSTVSVPDMREKTLRFPGHLEAIRVLEKSGFFSRHPVEVSGTSVRPLDLTTKLLFPLWQLGEGDRDFTIMRVCLETQEEITYHLYDEYDAVTAISSMARTTGYTCCAVAELILQGYFLEPGIQPPEKVGAHRDCFDRVLRYLEERGISLSVERR